MASTLISVCLSLLAAKIRSEGILLFNLLCIRSVSDVVANQGKSHPLLPHVRVSMLYNKLPGVESEQKFVYVDPTSPTDPFLTQFGVMKLH